MKKKLKIAFVFCVIIWLTSLYVNEWMFIVLTVIGLLSVIALVCFLLANKLVKKTNWWKNKYLATEQFVSNSGYRDNTIRNYDIVNLGSNPAHFAFFYEDVKGQSWSTGSQGQDMDFEILKYYHSYLKKGATVIIPIMPFSAISPYLKEREDYWGIEYYSKFTKILDRAQTRLFPHNKKISYYLRYPLIYNIKAVRNIVHDVKPDSRYMIIEQPLMKMELEQDASNWIKGWLKEFNLQSLNDVKEDIWKKYYDEAVDINKTIVDYCLERDLKPVFICVPMSKHLSSLFTEEFYQYMITDFVKKANVHNLPFLDYTKDAKYSDDKWFFNSFFMNLNGRKQFTKQVLKDLGISDIA